MLNLCLDGENNKKKNHLYLQISKSNVVDDMVSSNKVLYKDGEMPDHCVVIKYVPYVGE